MTSQINRQYQLAQRPSGLPGRDTFSFVETPLGEPAEGQILVKNEYLSLDPAMRGWMNDARSYIPPVGIGEVMRALGVGKVLVSKHPGFQAGDYVNGALGVQDYFIGEPKGFYKVDPSRAPLPRYLSALGMTGMTAYFALLDVGQPKNGETVVISGAAGAVGSVAGQIARLKGCRVVGIAGGAEKCRFWSKNWASTAPSTTRTKTSPPDSSANARRVSMCSSTTSAAKSSTQCSPASPSRHASSSAGRSASTTTRKRCAARPTTCRCWSIGRAWKAWW